MKVYAMYKGDVLVDVGTAKELSKKLGIKRETIYFYNTISYKKICKNSKNRISLTIVEQ